MFKEKVQSKYLIVANKNLASWHGKPFWIGIFNTLDEKIEDVYTYEQAKEVDFHHSMYMKQKFVEGIDNGILIAFWIMPEGINTNVDGKKSKINSLKSKILEQIKIKSK